MYVCGSLELNAHDKSADTRFNKLWWVCLFKKRQMLLCELPCKRDSDRTAKTAFLCCGLFGLGLSSGLAYMCVIFILSHDTSK